MSEKAFTPRLAPTDEVLPTGESADLGKDDLEAIRKLRDGFSQSNKN